MNSLAMHDSLSLYLEDDDASTCASEGNATLVKVPFIYFDRVSESTISEYQNMHQSLTVPCIQGCTSNGFCDDTLDFSISTADKNPGLNGNEYHEYNINHEMINGDFEQAFSTLMNPAFTSTIDPVKTQWEETHPQMNSFPSNTVSLYSISPMSDKRFAYQHTEQQNIPPRFRKAKKMGKKTRFQRTSMYDRSTYGNKTLDEIIDDCLQDSSKFYNMAKDKFNSKYLQQLIESACGNLSNDELFSVFDKLEFVLNQDIIKLSMNGYANYVVQKYLDCASSVGLEKRHNFVNNLIIKNGMNCSIIGFLAIDKSGCRILQNILEGKNLSWYNSKNMHKMQTNILTMHDLQNMSMVDKFLIGLRENFIECATNANGIHVIQKLMEHIRNPLKLHNMCNAFIGRVAYFACNKYSCRILQQLWKRCPKYMYAGMFEEVVGEYDQCLRMAMNEFGNYSLQCMIECCTSVEIVDELIGNVIIPNFLQLCKHKNGSNVCEIAFAYASVSQKESILDLLLVEDHGWSMVSIIGDEYGNYVAQKMVDIVGKLQYKYLYRRYRKYFISLMGRLFDSYECQRYGRNVIQNIRFLYNC